MTPDDARIFEDHREHLTLLAYGMVGSWADAEDLVQEAALRWLDRDRVPPVGSPRAYLSTVVTRLAINHLQSARVRRETYVGTWLPEPRSAPPEPAAQRSVEVSEELTYAFLVLLESLSPRERAVLVLRDVFHLPYPDVAEALGTSEAACRQALRRARAQLQARRPRFAVSDVQQRAVMLRFAEASRSGTIDGLLAVLAKDVRVVTDGGGQAPAALRTVHGADRAARFVLGSLDRLVPCGTRAALARVNGVWSVVAWNGEAPVAVLTAEVREGRIATLYIVTNPDKLGSVQVPPAGAPAAPGNAPQA